MEEHGVSRLWRAIPPEVYPPIGGQTSPAKALKAQNMGIKHRLPACMIPWSVALSLHWAECELEGRVLCDGRQKRILHQGEIDAGHPSVLSSMPACMFF